MKKLYFVFLLVFAYSFHFSQATLSIIQTPTNSGIYTITYNDAANGWAFFNPNSQPIGVYLWLNSSDTSTNSLYNDSWSNISTQLTWDGTNYTGTINLNTHNFNNIGGVLPAGTTVNQLHFIFTDSPAGNNSHKTPDYLASVYGFSSTTTSSLGVIDINKSNFKSFISDGKLYTSQKGSLDIQVYDFSGKLVKKLNANNVSSGLELNLPKKGNYLVKVNNEVVKIAY